MSHAQTLCACIIFTAACGGEAPPPAAPARYFLVDKQGAVAADGTRLGPGFGVSIRAEKLDDGERWGQTQSGRWLPMRALVPARPSKLRGVELPDGRLDVAWVAELGAPLYAGANAARILELLPLHERLRPSGAVDESGLMPVARGGQTAWVRARDVRRPERARVPDGADDERWLDIDLASNTLVAYQGARPVFATLVSTGVGRDGSPIATPRGLHRVYNKLRTADMDNAGHTDVVPYAYEAVPWVQYFSGNMALHGALWHDRFGHPASHGCVNLAPADAERLFAWTKVGTPVRVR